MKADLYIEAGLPSDEELERITDYVGHYMTRAERDAFETQLEEDDAFFFRVAPVLDAWYGTGSQHTAKPAPRAAQVRRPVALWAHHRLIALGSLASIAAGVAFYVVQPATHVAPQSPLVAKGAQPPAPVVPPQTIVAPPPTVVAVRPRIVKHVATPAPVVAITEPDPVLVTIDSAAEAALAQWADSARAAAFVPPARVADTVQAVGVEVALVWKPSKATTTTETVSKYPTAVGSNAAANNQSRGLVGLIKRLLGKGDKS